MAKMTLTDLKTQATAYVAAAKQAGVFAATTNNLIGLVDKIGKIVMLDGTFTDKLPEFDGENLPLGKTIEEYFIDLIAPSNYDATGANNDAPSYPSVEAAAYSYSLGRKMFKTTQKYDDLERACLSEADFANMTAKIVGRLGDSENMWRYQEKKQLIANLIAKAGTAHTVAIAAPTDTSTGEAAIKQIKGDVETASFANEGNSLNGQLIGAAPELVLLVKKGVVPSWEVDTMAGAIHPDYLSTGVKIKVVDDFANADAKVWGVLIDPRGVRLHEDYRAVRNHENADGDFMNFVLHVEATGFISKNTFVKVYKGA